MTIPVYERLDDLLDTLGEWRLEPMDKHVDSLSGAPFERAVVGDRRYVVKHIAPDSDWLMRVLHDGAGGTPPRALIAWREGLHAALPGCLDPVIVGMAYDGRRLSQVMTDIGPTLVPPGGAPVDHGQHRRFLDHMAALHAAFWGFTDAFGLTTPQDRYGFSHPRVTQHEPEGVPALFPGGWAAVRAVAPETAELALGLAADVSPLARAMADGPQTFVHGDWKFGNLGSHPDGRTVLLDWAWHGQAPPLVDLGWYLAVNCDRLPESKEDTIDAYREALERAGVHTGGWWSRQLDLALLGAFLQLGWSKSDSELAWWVERVTPTAAGLR
jgi:hypothetical protein